MLIVQQGTESIAHSRKTYSLLELFGDLGGLAGLLSTILGTLIGPWAAFKFDFKAIQKLYFVFTRTQGLFLAT